MVISLMTSLHLSVIPLMTSLNLSVIPSIHTRSIRQSNPTAHTTSFTTNLASLRPFPHNLRQTRKTLNTFLAFPWCPLHTNALSHSTCLVISTSLIANIVKVMVHERLIRIYTIGLLCCLVANIDQVYSLLAGICHLGVFYLSGRVILTHLVNILGATQFIAGTEWDTWHFLDLEECVWLLFVLNLVWFQFFVEEGFVIFWIY